MDDFGGFEITTEGGGDVAEGDKGAELSVNFDVDFSSLEFVFFLSSFFFILSPLIFPFFFSTPSEIDWDVTSSSSSAPTEDLQIEILDSSSSSSSPFQKEVLLQKTETRRQILTELMELRLFLKQRMVEMKGKASLLSSNQFQFASSIVQKQSLSSVQGFLEGVERFSFLCICIFIYFPFYFYCHILFHFILSVSKEPFSFHFFLLFQAVKGV